MQPQWLTPESAESEALALLKSLRSAARATTASSYPEEVEHAAVARAIGERFLAARQIQQFWFYAGVGVSFGGDEDETWYLSKCPYSYVFVDYNLVPWTNWIGALHVAVMEHVRKRTFPRDLIYGPPGRETRKPVGPVVNYTIVGDTLTKHDFYFHDVLTRTALPEANASQTPGLKDIIATLDATQDKTIRSALTGTFVVHGGPGTGKTTAALHRIPYLINEQNAEEGPGTSHYSESTPRFFTQETTIVAVWKDHLVPHLTQCLADLGFDRVRVQHIEDWVAERVRPHVSFGMGSRQVRLEDEPPGIADLKLCIPEDALEQYLLGHHSLVDNLRERYARTRDEVNEWLTLAGSKAVANAPPTRFTVDEAVASLSVFEQPIQTQIRALRVVGKNFNQRQIEPGWPEYITDDEARRREVQRRVAIREAIDAGEALLSKLQSRERELVKLIRTSPVPLLRSLYASAECRAAVEKEFGRSALATLQEHVKTQSHDRTVSRADRYLILWILRILSRHDSLTADDAWKPLPEYSHIVVDEAQYYRPLLLRLLHSLTLAPHHSMTIAGDLEQRIRHAEGLVSWDEAGIAVPPENYTRLETNYRWARAIYDFLVAFRKAASLDDPLQPPDEWYSGDGLKPDIVACESHFEECDTVVQRIARLKSDEESKTWTIAIVLPGNEETEIAKLLRKQCEGCDLRARWVVGQDLRESRDHIVMTSYDHIVGLEFDAVFVACADEIVQDLEAEEALRAIWVAITRARKYQCISYVGAVSLFEQPGLDEYHRDPSEWD